MPSLARQVWTSQALVSEPTVTQVANLQLRLEQFRSATSPEGIDFTTLQRPALYQGFITAFNAMNNKRLFLTQEGIFAEEMKLAGVADRRSEQALMYKLAEGISAKELSKTANSTLEVRHSPMPPDGTLRIP